MWAQHRAPRSVDSSVDRRAGDPESRRLAGRAPPVPRPGHPRRTCLEDLVVEHIRYTGDALDLLDQRVLPAEEKCG